MTEEGAQGTYTGDLELDRIRTREELFERLSILHRRADSPSLRALEKWANGNGREPLSKNTVAELLRGQKLPRRDVVLMFVEACGVPRNRLGPWRVAWERAAAPAPVRPAPPVVRSAAAEDVLGEARAEADRIRRSAEQEARAIRGRAKARAEAILRQARQQADTLVRDALDNAAALLMETQPAVPEVTPAGVETSVRVLGLARAVATSVVAELRREAYRIVRDAHVEAARVRRNAQAVAGGAAFEGEPGSAFSRGRFRDG